MQRIPIRYYILRTNYDWNITYRVTGDYSAKNFYFDITAGDGTKLFAASIPKTYSSGTGKTTLVISITKTQIAGLIVGNQYFADLKLDDTVEIIWLKAVFDTEIGQTSSAL